MYFAVCLEFSCEIGFPAGEAISIGGIMTGGCLYSFFISPFINYLIQNSYLSAFIIFFLIHFIIALYFLSKI